MSDVFQVRPACASDVHGIVALVDGYAAQAVMLPRAESIALVGSGIRA